MRRENGMLSIDKKTDSSFSFGERGREWVRPYTCVWRRGRALTPFHNVKYTGAREPLSPIKGHNQGAGGVAFAGRPRVTTDVLPRQFSKKFRNSGLPMAGLHSAEPGEQGSANQKNQA